MAVAFELRFKGATLEMYDEVMELMNLHEGGPRVMPDGALFHWAAKTDDGIVVMDVWESDEQFQRFADSQIGPFTAQVGFTAPPEITRYEVHSTLGPSG